MADEIRPGNFVFYDVTQLKIAIAYGYQKFDQTVTWTAVIIMIVLVQVVQGIANAIAKRLLKRQQ